jgi:UDP-glucose 4-epimerase
MNFFVTGGAGFLGSTFCDAMLERGHAVTCFDNFSTGRLAFLEQAQQRPRFTLIRGDITDFAQLQQVLKGFDWVAHFAANADVRRGLEHPRRDLEINTIGTWNVLEAARQGGTKHLLFTSTGSVYGEPETFPVREDAPYPEQTSLYAASKLAGEGLISAYCHGYGLHAAVFRLVSILGPRYTHGHVYDFMQKLSKDPTRLEVLGDGSQLKSYLHVYDLMAAFELMIEKGGSGYQLSNVGHDQSLRVHQSVALITARMGLTPVIEYSGGKRGWVGDSPRIELDTTRLRARGWKPTRSLEQAVHDTVDYLQANPALLQPLPTAVAAHV